MSERLEKEGVLSIAEEGSLAMMKVQGRGERNLADGFDAWISHLVESKTIGCVIVDMAECTYVDSTFMGLLVKLASLTMARYTLLIANANVQLHELLDGIGVMRGWKYVEQPVVCDNWKSLCDAISGKLNPRLVVEVHERLIEWDERNRKFIPFVELGKAELAKMEQDADDGDDDDE